MTDKAKIMAVVEDMRITASMYDGVRDEVIDEWADRLTALCAEEAGVQEPVKMLPNKRKIFYICNAYESGFGKGLEASDNGNPYKDTDNEHEAWNYGYQEGYAKFLAKDAAPPSAQSLIDAAREECARVCQAEIDDAKFCGKSLAYVDAAVTCKVKIEFLIGQPLKKGE